MNEFRVRIRFVDPDKSSVHRIRNFGEDLWSSYRGSRRVHVDIGAVDSAVDEIVFVARTSSLRSSIKEINRLLEAHLMSGEAVIETEQI